MKIPQKLEQFNEEKALLVVCGAKEASFLLLHKGEIIVQDNFRIVKEEFRKEKEGLFRKGGRGRIFEIGAIFEPKKRKIEQEFFEKLKTYSEKIINREKIDSIYIFAPGYILKSLRLKIPSLVKEKVKMFKRGNFTGYHPIKLVEIITEVKREKKVVPISKEAKKILDRFKIFKKRNSQKEKKE